MAQAAACGDWQFASGQLVDNLAIGRLFTGLEADQLGRAFAEMPAGTPGAAPALVAAACRLPDQDLSGCEAGLRRADDYLTDESGPEARLTRAFVGVLAGRLADDVAATERAAADADRLLGELPGPLLAERPEIRALMLAGLGAAELGAGRLDRAETVLTAAVDACGAPGTEYPLCDALGSLALAELRGGRLRQAAEHAHAALAVAEQSALPPERRTGVAHLVLAGVATEHDDLAAARDHLDLATAAAGPRPERVAAVEAAVIGARLAASEGDGRAAIGVLHAAGTAGAPPRPQVWALAELAAAESAVHLAHGDAAAALAALDGVDAAAAGRPEHAVARARALLAAGRADQAAEALAELPAADGLSAPVRARACLLRAEAAAADGADQEARRRLAEALGLARPEELRRIFAESGPWVRRALRQDPEPARVHGWLLSRSPAPAGASPAAGQPLLLEPLSPRETEVLRQAARMLSTAEIAAELFVSANTVKTHLKSVYRKLSVTRRSEAVHRAQDLGLL
ncbi:LuxR C-terminal-related transcriptional regulator [Streptomyces nojiriensis]